MAPALEAYLLLAVARLAAQLGVALPPPPRPASARSASVLSSPPRKKPDPLARTRLFPFRITTITTQSS